MTVTRGFQNRSPWPYWHENGIICADRLALNDVTKARMPHNRLYQILFMGQFVRPGFSAGFEALNNWTTISVMIRHRALASSERFAQISTKCLQAFDLFIHGVPFLVRSSSATCSHVESCLFLSFQYLADLIQGKNPDSAHS